jgi:hypothetical protein
VRITESELKKIISKELKRLAEAAADVDRAVEKATNLSDYYDALGMDIPSLSARRRLAARFGMDPKRYTGSKSGNTELLKLLKKDRALMKQGRGGISGAPSGLDPTAPSGTQVAANDKPQTETEPIKDRVMKMLQFYDTGIYGSSLGPYISKYNGMPGGSLFIKAGSRLAGDLGMLDDMPADLDGLKSASRNFLPKTGNDFVDETLAIAHRLVKTMDFEDRGELAVMLGKAMTGGMTLEQIQDAKVHLDYLEKKVKKKFVLYGSDSSRKKAKTKTKQQKALKKLLNHFKKRGPEYKVTIQDLEGRSGPRDLASGNVLSKFITPNSTPEQIRKKIRVYYSTLGAAMTVADSMRTGALKLDTMMKKDPKAAEYIKQFILAGTD